MRISHSQEISMENFLGNVSYHMGIDVCSYPRYFTDNHRTTNRWSFFSYLKRTITIDCITLGVKTHVKLVELNQLHFASILTSLGPPRPFLTDSVQVSQHQINSHYIFSFFVTPKCMFHSHFCIKHSQTFFNDLLTATIKFSIIETTIAIYF